VSDPRDQCQAALAKRYALERELGRGGMATVYLARDLRHQRPVALKVLRPELGAALGAERFLREIRIAAQLQHPHILALIDSGELTIQGSRPTTLLYYVMPYVEGESLRERLQREGQLPLDEVVRLTAQVAEALAYAHQHGIVHRDIKPENILLTGYLPREGDAAGREPFGRVHALVADFGIALAVTQAGAERLTETGLSLGTPAYMSPEQASGEHRLDGRADQYSLACVVYEMLAGEPPYTGATPQSVIAKRLTEPIPRLSTLRAVPSDIEAVVTRALARAPADRYQTVSQFAEALAKATVAGTADSPARHPRSQRIWLTSAAALALLTLSVGWWGVSKARTEAATLRGVALLPCENTSPRQEEAYIGDRWSEELIQKLVRVGGLNPKAWESVRRYRDTRLGVRQIGADLNAGTLVRCRVAEQPTGVRLNVELIRAHDERVIWSNDYQRPAGADGINAAQSAAAREIARELGVDVPPRAVAAVERPLTTDTTALRLYRFGEHFLESFEEPSSVRRSMDYFERAIARDSNFARAYVGLAGAMMWLTERESRVSRDYYPAVAQLLRRAIVLDPTIAEAHTGLARYLLDYTHDWAGAEDEHRQALALNPSSVQAHAGTVGTWKSRTASRRPSRSSTGRSSSIRPISCRTHN
jgi:serine/threonine-protein kinase